MTFTENIDIHEFAELDYRGRLRARRLVLVVVVLFLGVAPFAWKAAVQLATSAWLQLNHYHVAWVIDRETWRRGGVTTVRAVLAFDPFGHPDLTHLTRLHNLEELDLSQVMGLADDDLPMLAELIDLQSLDLNRSHLQYRYPTDKGGLTDVTLARIGTLTDLRELDLGGQKFGDQGLASLKRLTKLESLNLQGTAITDAGLEALKGLPKLRYLDLGGTKITQAGILAFEATRPGVVIEADPFPL
ncbi:leucine-rich repeat domain-containing protein [Tundrisphaera lichenicola]|uniref:leucine-rich repeat domain-containing protein n=1 Tax=Tundrisphaera lichenicola TaxID=2029860 RepID=UPI003EC0A4AF